MPAHSVIWLFVDEDLREAIDPVYNAAVKREIDKLAAAEELVSDFSIGTECGFDRCDPTPVPELFAHPCRSRRPI